MMDTRNDDITWEPFPEDIANFKNQPKKKSLMIQALFSLFFLEKWRTRNYFQLAYSPFHFFNSPIVSSISASRYPRLDKI